MLGQVLRAGLNQPEQEDDVMRSRNLESAQRSTALMAFSTVCCAWKPTTSSSWSGSGARARAADRSDAALRSRRSATSSSSGVGKDAALAQGALDQRAADGRAPTSTVAIDDDHVDGDEQISELSSETHRLPGGVGHLRLDHEHVVVGPILRLVAGVRAKENHARVPRGRASKARSDLLDDLIRRHAGDGSR